tara:strand:- start:24 stop:719 length:696 start_codon:yes stop_codon:yes gene_type:complete
MAEEKRVEKGAEAAKKVFHTVIMSLPEFENDPDAAKNLAKQVSLELFRASVRSKGEPYEEYKDTKESIKGIKNQVATTLGARFGLSKSSTNRLQQVVGASIQLAKEGEVKIPPQRVIDQQGVTVDVGGYIDPENNIYQPDISARVQDPFGVEGLAVTGQLVGDFKEPIRDMNIGTSYRLGNESDISIGVDPISEEARVGFKARFKKGGKVKKKNKNKKNYAKGSTVRTANY